MCLIKSVPLMFTWRFVRPPAAFCWMATWGKKEKKKRVQRIFQLFSFENNHLLYSLFSVRRFQVFQTTVTFFFFFFGKSICSKQMGEDVWKDNNKLVVNEHSLRSQTKAWLWGPRGFPKHNLSILLIPAETLPLPSVCTRPTSIGQVRLPATRRRRRERKAFNGAAIYYLPHSSSFRRRRSDVILSLSPTVKSDQL